MGGLSGAASAETRRVSFRLVVRPEVDADLLQAEAWYEEQQPGGMEVSFAARLPNLR